MAFFATLVAVACFEATKTEMVCFSTDSMCPDATFHPPVTPGASGKGHPLTSDNCREAKAKVGGAVGSAAESERLHFGRGDGGRPKVSFMFRRVAQSGR